MASYIDRKIAEFEKSEEFISVQRATNKAFQQAKREAIASAISNQVQRRFGLARNGGVK